MIIKTLEIDTEEHAKELEEILSKLTYVKIASTICVKDFALGQVNEPTDNQLTQFFTEDSEDEVLIPSSEVFRKFKN